MKVLRYGSLLIPLVISVYFWIGTPYVPLHGDEPTQMYMGLDAYYQWVAGDLSLVMYDPETAAPDKQELRLINGTLPKYLIGLGMIHMGSTPDNWQKPYDWGADFTYNQQNVHIPPAEMLTALRYVHTALTIGAVWGVYALGWMLGSWPAAGIAALIFGLNPAVLIDGRRVMMEGALLFFSVWAVVLAMVLVRELMRPGLRKRLLPLALLFGLAGGLALASKHTAIFTLAALWIGLFCVLVYRAMRITRNGLIAILLVGLLSLATMLATFYALNPAWWGAPIERAFTVLDLRQNLLNGQIAAFGGYPDFAAQTTGFFNQAFVVLPQYYQVENWREPLQDAIATYENSGYAGVAIGGSAIGAVLWLALVVIGAVQLIHKSADGWLMLIWGAAMVGLTWFITPLEWQRYYLPLYPWLAVVGALGCVMMVQRLLQRKRS